jgi:hypothetical protein
MAAFWKRRNQLKEGGGRSPLGRGVDGEHDDGASAGTMGRRPVNLGPLAANLAMYDRHPTPAPSSGTPAATSDAGEDEASSSDVLRRPVEQSPVEKQEPDASERSVTDRRASGESLAAFTAFLGR